MSAPTRRSTTSPGTCARVEHSLPQRHQHGAAGIVGLMKRWLWSAFAFALAACTSGEASPRDAAVPRADASDIDASMADHDGDTPEPGKNAPSAPVTFAPSDAILLNPERGFYTTTLLTAPGDLAYVRAEGKTLVYAAVHLDEYLGSDHEKDLPAELLTDVQAGFDAIRAAGMKAVVRFQYDNGE